MFQRCSPRRVYTKHKEEMMFPAIPLGPGNMNERTPVRVNSELERRCVHNSLQASPNHRIPAQAHSGSNSGAPGVHQPNAQGPDIRSSLTSVSLRTISTAGIQPFPNLGMTPVPCQPGIAMPSPMLQYPTALYPSISSSASNELKQLTLAQYHGMNHHSAFPTDFSKYKTPFINRNYLELAMLVCNTFRGKLFPCPHCRYVTDRRNNLKRHISTMHQACEKVLECCGVTFTTKASLREHIMIFHHNGYSCPYCGRRFCRKALLKRHLSVHSGQKDYSCPHCDYATSHKSNLERHKRIHDRLKTMDDCSIIDVEKIGDHLPDTTLRPTCLSADDSDVSDDELNVTDDAEMPRFVDMATEDNLSNAVQSEVEKTALNLCTTHVNQKHV